MATMFEFPANNIPIDLSTNNYSKTALFTEVQRSKVIESISNMTEAEYRQLINDIWIGIILSLIVISFLVCFCSCFMYHKFQLWKRHYDARSRIRSNGNGMSTGDLETLPNYSLVSGLPTYDDAIEALRLSNTNHRLIKHQTIMKFFESVNEKMDRSETPLPSYEDSMVKATPPDWLQKQIDSKNISYTVLPIVNHSHATVHGTCHIEQQLLPKPADTEAASRQHRFQCILVPEPVGTSSTTNNTVASITATAATTINSEQSQHSLPVGNSLGSLNIINEIRNSRPEIPWMHGSALSLSLDYDSNQNRSSTSRSEHRASLH